MKITIKISSKELQALKKEPCNSRVQDIKQIQQIKRLYREHIIDVLTSATGKDSLVTTEINDCVRILSHLEKQEELNRK